MDHLTPKQRSKNMAAIRNKDTNPEMIVYTRVPLIYYILCKFRDN